MSSPFFPFFFFIVLFFPLFSFFLFFALQQSWMERHGKAETLATLTDCKCDVERTRNPQCLTKWNASAQNSPACYMTKKPANFHYSRSLGRKKQTFFISRKNNFWSSATSRHPQAQGKRGEGALYALRRSKGALNPAWGRRWVNVGSTSGLRYGSSRAIPGRFLLIFAESLMNHKLKGFLMTWLEPPHSPLREKNS